MKGLLRIAFTFALTTWLAGCGFQLRGQPSSLEQLPAPLYVAGVPPYRELHRLITRAAQAAGAQISVEGDQALVLKIEERRSERRVLSVDRRNKVVEYELEESFLFSLHGAAREELIQPQRLRSLRIHLNPDVQVLGRNREEDKLRSDMRRELAQRVVERLSAQF